MVDVVDVISGHNGARLALSEPYLSRHGDWAHFTVDLRHGGLLAMKRVDEINPDALAEFFGDLAANWTGWTGRKSWSSIEDDFRLDAGCDPLGHVDLVVELRESSIQPWSARGVVIIDAGAQMKRFAGEVRAFFSI